MADWNGNYSWAPPRVSEAPSAPPAPPAEQRQSPHTGSHNAGGYQWTPQYPQQNPGFPYAPPSAPVPPPTGGYQGQSVGGPPALQGDRNICNANVRTGPEKKALLIGCSYPSQGDNQLRSCCNDARLMMEELVDNFGYSPNNVVLLVDASEFEGIYRSPTRLNIIKGINWLVSGARSGDKLFFHFSGHGTSSRDYSGDEASGESQCLMPTDHEQSGVLVDDDINRWMIRPLPEGCTLHALVDCCHSGTVMDLQFTADLARVSWCEESQAKAYKGTNGGVAFQFAACKDRQRAYGGDSAVDGGNGAATCAFLQAVRDPCNTVTYSSVLSAMAAGVRDFQTARQQKTAWKRFVQGVQHPKEYVLGRLYQKPQLSSSTDSIPLNSVMMI